MDYSAKIDHFVRLVDRLCTVSVCLKNKQKEIDETRDLVINLSGIYPTCIINLQKYNLHLAVLKNDAKKLYDEYVSLNKEFSSFIQNEDEKILYKAVIPVTEKEHQLNNEIVKDRALGVSDDNIAFVTDLAKAYYDYIETIHFVLDERNDLKLRRKMPR